MLNPLLAGRVGLKMRGKWPMQILYNIFLEGQRLKVTPLYSVSSPFLSPKINMAATSLPRACWQLAATRSRLAHFLNCIFIKTDQLFIGNKKYLVANFCSIL